MGATDEVAEERCMEVYKEEEIKVYRCIYKTKKKVTDQFRRKVNHDVNRNRKLFWNEVSKANEERGRVYQNKG